jgi:hypothetical protein
MTRIRKQGADWLNPYAPPTAWQRERWSTWDKVHHASSRSPERWWQSLAAAGFVFAVGVVAWMVTP